MDSTLALLMTLQKHKRVRGLFFNIGQYSAPRQKAIIMQQSLILNLPVDYIDIPGGVWLFPWVGPPHTLATEVGPSGEPGVLDHGCWDSMWSISLGAVSAANNGSKALVHGSTKEDAARLNGLPKLIEHLTEATRINTQKPDFAIETPVIGKTQSDVLKDMLQHQELPTWSCSYGHANHCGTCPTCETRKARFAAIGADDPTKYGS